MLDVEHTSDVLCNPQGIWIVSVDTVQCLIPLILIKFSCGTHLNGNQNFCVTFLDDPHPIDWVDHALTCTTLDDQEGA